MLNSTNVTAYVKDCAIEMGFDLVAITTAAEFDNDRAAALDRISSGHMDGLSWYTPERVQRGTRPAELLTGARSIICLGLNYFDGDSPPLGSTATIGKVARYARGRDYHKVMKKRMRHYVETLSKRLDTSISARWYVDDGPMLDRAAARRSGLGWFGKNSNILSPSLGSWIFLGQVITDLELEPDQTISKTCGNCVRCIDACPTGAIVAPYVIDNTRCISYQTIENRGPIPPEMRPLMLDWVFGCDICQEVCPVNRKARPSIEPAFKGKKLSTLDLAKLLELTDAEFLREFQGTPIMRAKRVGLARNACVALGNQGDLSAIPALAKAMDHDEPLVRGHSAWAIGKIGGDWARAALGNALTKENDEYVRQEIADAIQRLEIGSKKSGCAAAVVSQPTPGVATPSQPAA